MKLVCGGELIFKIVDLAGGFGQFLDRKLKTLAFKKLQVFFRSFFMKIKYFFYSFFIFFLSSCSHIVPSEYDYNLKKSNVTEEKDNYTKSNPHYVFSPHTIGLEDDLNGRMNFTQISVETKTKLTIFYEINNNSGKLSLIITDNNQWVKSIVELNDTSTNDQISLTLDKGTYFMKFIGEDASFNSEFKFEYPSEMLNITVTKIY